MIRHTKTTRCLVCEGADTDKRGADKRCYGFLSEDGKWEHCTREEFAGGLPCHPNSRTYAHLIGGDCKCGVQHAPPPLNGHGPASTPIAYYEYLDETESPLYRVIRYLPKSFSQQRWDAARKDWVGGEGCMKGVRRVPYRLPELVASTGPILILEGEKDVDNAWALGFPATCNVGGAKKWLDSYSEFLKGRKCILVPDQDQDGSDHSKLVAESLSKAGVRHKTVQIPAKDLSAWIASEGFSRDKLDAVVHARPDWKKSFGTVPVNATELAGLVDEPIPFIVSPLIVRGYLTQLQGVPKGGKSAFAVYLSLCATTGIWPQPEIMNSATPCRVLYIAWEDPKLMMAKRLSLYALGLGFERTFLPENLIFLFGPDIFIEEDLALDALKAAASDLKPDIVVIDTLSHIHSCDENSSSEMKLPMKHLDKFAKESDIGVLYLHHTAKGSGERILQDKGRGSSAIAAAWHVLIDWGLRADGSNSNPVKIQSKFEHAEIAWDVLYEKSEDQNQVTTEVRWQIQGTQKKEKKSVAQLKRESILSAARRLRAFEEGWFTCAVMVGECGLGLDSKTIKRQLTSLVQEGSLEMKESPTERGGSPTHLYRIRDGNLLL